MSYKRPYSTWKNYYHDRGDRNTKLEKNDIITSNEVTPIIEWSDLNYKTIDIIPGIDYITSHIFTCLDTDEETKSIKIL